MSWKGAFFDIWINVFLFSLDLGSSNFEGSGFGRRGTRAESISSDVLCNETVEK